MLVSDMQHAVVATPFMLMVAAHFGGVRLGCGRYVVGTLFVCDWVVVGVCWVCVGFHLVCNLSAVGFVGSVV